MRTTSVRIPCETRSVTPTDRALRLLSLLQAGGDLPAGLLARRLGVSERTVRRDARRLRDLGYDVRSRPGPGSGYRLHPGVRIPPLLFTEDEVAAVAAGLGVLAAWAPEDEAAVAAAGKLAQVLPPRLARRARAVALSTQVLRTGIRPAVDVAVIGTIADAVAAGTRVRFSYTDGEGRATRRLTEPYRHVLRGDVWYLVAFDVDRDDWRLFRLDRVTDAEPAPGTARERPFPEASVEAWLASDFGRARPGARSAPGSGIARGPGS
ncbi:WYL domain-containing protein [Microbacterium sp. EF45047]|nr:WYL domain-containing protein [Microbacterium sp. EF45047]